MGTIKDAVIQNNDIPPRATKGTFQMEIAASL